MTFQKRRMIKRADIAIILAVLCVAWPARLSGQSRECQDIAWDKSNSPVYVDAIEVERELSDRGFVVECIRRSKEERLFPGQKGAAWFKTDRGIFEVWFLPKSETFAALQVIEQPMEGRYAYSFQGTPRITTKMNSPRRLYFIKRGNVLFEVWGDRPLAESLEKAFPNP